MMRVKILSGVICLMLGLSACAGEALPQSSHEAYAMLWPRSTVELFYFGECKKLTNHAKRGVAYVTVGSAEVWHGFKDHFDKHGTKIVGVQPCAF
jgi:hypothetical protein